MDSLTPTGSLPVLTAALETVHLDLSDPFERTVLRMVTNYRAKRHDYTPPGETPWWNFDATEKAENVPWMMGVWYEITKKRNRLKALAARGVEPLNESAEDSYRDIATYGTIAWARFLYPRGVVE